MDLTERQIWQCCFWAGFVTLILGAIVLLLFPKGNFVYPEGYGDPVLAFEFARTATDVKAAIGFGTAGWEDRLVSMIRGTYADFLFITAFGIFISSFFLAAFRQTGRGVFKVFAVIAIIAALSDIIEDGFALRILSNIETASGVMWMHYFVKIKFLGLGLVGLGAALFLIGQPRILRKLEGVLALIGGAITLFALSRPSEMGAFLGLGVTISWLAILAYAATHSFKRAKIS